MYQMVIILPATLDLKKFDEGWPEFLEKAEQMPGLIQESVTRFDQVLFGEGNIQRFYSFSFNDRESLEQALTTEVGEKAGNILHIISNGNITILSGEYQTDTMNRINSFSSQTGD
jgi:hypothetical protein